jgi:site-specific DNA recombinase
MAPLGYRLMDAEKRGTKVKKKLAVDPGEAETVRLVFNLYLHGDGKSGALGVKEIVKWLNARGYRTRGGKTFGVGSSQALDDHHLHRSLECSDEDPLF